MFWFQWIDIDFDFYKMPVFTIDYSAYSIDVTMNRFLSSWVKTLASLEDWIPKD
jgi:hypothetical protein